MSSITQPRNQYVVDGVPVQRRGWSDEDVQFVKDKWGAGWSATQIVNELPGRTRNSVLGLIDRKGFARTVRNTNQHTRTVEPTPLYQRKPRAERRKAWAGRKAAAPRPPKPPMSAQPEIRTRDRASYPKPTPLDIGKFEEPSDGAGVSLLELTNESCRWPKGTPGEPGFVFCGEATADLRDDKPYCPFHMRKRRIAS